MNSIELKNLYEGFSQEEDVVTYEQALKLRELGFDRPTLLYYSDGGKLTLQRHAVYSFYNSMNQSFGNDRVCDAPLLANVLKWLSEEKKIDIGIQHHYWPEGIFYELTLGDRETLEDEFIANYKSYEEALRTGIDEAIRVLSLYDKENLVKVKTKRKMMDK